MIQYFDAIQMTSIGGNGNVSLQFDIEFTSTLDFSALRLNFVFIDEEVLFHISLSWRDIAERFQSGCLFTNIERASTAHNEYAVHFDCPQSGRCERLHGVFFV